MEIALKETQTRFMHSTCVTPDMTSPLTMVSTCEITRKRGRKDGSLKYIASTYDPYDQIIRDGLYPGGRKVITFANILQHDVFPLPRILQLALKYGQQEMRRPVEINLQLP